MVITTAKPLPPHPVSQPDSMWGLEQLVEGATHVIHAVIAVTLMIARLLRGRTTSLLELRGVALIARSNEPTSTSLWSARILRRCKKNLALCEVATYSRIILAKVPHSVRAASVCFINVLVISVAL